jgi:hypothetical protein
MTTRDFPCFVCGSTGPHQRTLIPRDPDMTDDEWAQVSPPALIYCGSCRESIWEPDTGDGVVAPNLTMIRPGLRDLAVKALEARQLSQFLILAERHHRNLLIEDNAVYWHRRGMHEEVLLAQLRLVQPD